MVVVTYYDTITASQDQKDDKIPESLLKILSDDSAISILRSAISPKSAYQLSMDCNVSLTTIYRHVKKLSDKKLLLVSGSIDNSGKKHFTFKSKNNVYCKCACSNIDLSPFTNPKK